MTQAEIQDAAQAPAETAAAAAPIRAYKAFDKNLARAESSRTSITESPMTASSSGRRADTDHLP